MVDASELQKIREIVFTELASDPTPADSAALLLKEINGVLGISTVSPHCLAIKYELPLVTLRVLEEFLVEIGFHLDNSILSKIRSALYHFTEETQLANMGYDHAESKSTQQIFINRYLQKKHGCRDQRPKYYHHYN